MKAVCSTDDKYLYYKFATTDKIHSSTKAENVLFKYPELQTYSGTGSQGTKPLPHSCARFPIVEANILGIVGGIMLLRRPENCFTSIFCKINN